MKREFFLTKNVQEFVAKYANWNDVKSLSLTFDIDWAPDFMIEEVINILDKYSIKATFYATHHSKLLEELKSSIDFEVGIHPYLGVNSTQGENKLQILTNLNSIYNEAIGCRFHVLDFSYRDLLNLKNFKIKYDVSRINFNTPYLLPTYHKDLDLVLFTYSWEDGVSENQNLNQNINNIDLLSPGMKILNFHPMNIYINSPNAEFRKRFQSKNPKLLETDKNEIKGFINNGLGTKNILIELCEYIKKNNILTYTIKEYYSYFPKSIYHVYS